jgi:hypothetical protein
MILLQDDELKAVLDSCINDPNCINNARCRRKATQALTEIMRRSKKNVDRIVNKLRRMGYRFAFPDEARVFPIPRLRANITRIESAGFFLPLSANPGRMRFRI